MTEFTKKKKKIDKISASQRLSSTRFFPRSIPGSGSRFHVSTLVARRIRLAQFPKYTPSRRRRGVSSGPTPNSGSPNYCKDLSFATKPQSTGSLIRCAAFAGQYLHCRWSGEGRVGSRVGGGGGGQQPRYGQKERS